MGICRWIRLILCIRLLGKRDIVLILDLLKERLLERLAERNRVQLRIALRESLDSSFLITMYYTKFSLSNSI